MLRTSSPISSSVSNDNGDQYARRTSRSADAPNPLLASNTRVPALAQVPVLATAGVLPAQNISIATLAPLTQLPADFVPNMNHVIMGRGKKAYGHVGNKRFLAIVASRVNAYAHACTKNQKSDIVQNVLDQVEATGGGFLRLDAKTGLYAVAEEGAGREKTSQCLRDGLDGKYKSSKAIKRYNRKEKRMAKSKQVLHESDSCRKPPPRLVSESESKNSTRYAPPKTDLGTSHFLQNASNVTLQQQQQQQQQQPFRSPALPAPSSMLPLSDNVVVEEPYCCKKKPRRTVSLDRTSPFGHHRQDDNGSHTTIIMSENVVKLRSLSGNLQHTVPMPQLADFITRHNYAIPTEQPLGRPFGTSNVSNDYNSTCRSNIVVGSDDLEPLPITLQELDLLDDYLEPMDPNIFF